MFIWETEGGVLKKAKGSGLSSIFFETESETIKDVYLGQKNNKLIIAGYDNQSVVGFKIDGSKLFTYKLPTDVVVKDISVMIDFEEYYVSFNDANTNQLYIVDHSG